jgi:penicillin amidase
MDVDIGLYRAPGGFTLADQTTTRILPEPDARNHKAIARLTRTGLVLGPEVELPHERAQLVSATPPPR